MAGKSPSVDSGLAACTVAPTACSLPSRRLERRLSRCICARRSRRVARRLTGQRRTKAVTVLSVGRALALAAPPTCWTRLNLRARLQTVLAIDDHLLARRNATADHRNVTLR